MGQRIQLIVRVPAVYWNPDNPNNKPERVLVFHNQWLYGMGFVEHLEKIISGIEILLNEDHDTRYPIEYSDIVEKAIKHANCFNIRCMTNTHSYATSTDNEDYTQEIQIKGVMEFLKFLDNNNGYMYIEINATGQPRTRQTHKISYGIINGLEDADERKNRTPRQYVNLFYDDTKIIDMGDWEFMRALVNLNKYEQVDVFKRLEEIKNIPIDTKANA